MVYNVIGLMSGSSLDGLDIVFAELQEQSGKWNFQIVCASCIAYDEAWEKKLKNATLLTAKEYLLLHTDYGNFTGKKINEFINENQLHHKVNLIASHGHTTFHFPGNKMTHQLGNGATIAAETRLPVVSELRAMDIAFGGQGAPIVPLGEKLLFPAYQYFLNIGGIANLSVNKENEIIAFDVCVANRVLNLFALDRGLPYDEDGKMASQGNIKEDVLEKLNALDYYKISHPKSLDNSFGLDVVYLLLQSFPISIEDTLCTYVEHICLQIKNSLSSFQQNEKQTLFISGGGAFNIFLIERLTKHLSEINFEIFIPADEVVKYKEALIMALLGALRWREQYTVLSTVTGASVNSIGGALWLGTEA